MKTLNKVLLAVLTLTSLHSFADSGVSKHLSAASKHSALAASHGVTASAKVGSAVVAVPLIVVGVAGYLSLEAGVSLMDNALKAKPLDITEKTITAAPSPKNVMKVGKRETL